MTVGALPTMFVFGRIVGRIERGALPLCLLAMGCAAFWLANASDLVSIIIALLLLGASSGALDIALNLRVSTLERVDGLRLFDKAHAALPLAFLVASPAAGWLRDAGIGIDTIFATAGGILVLAGAWEWRASAQGAGTLATPVEPSEAALPGHVPALLLLLGGLGALGAFQEMAATNWAAIHVVDVLSGSATMGGLAPGMFMFGLFLGRLAADRAGAGREDFSIIRVAALFGVPAFGLIAVSSFVPLTIVGFVIAGMAVGPIKPAIYRTVTRRAPDVARGAWLSIVTGTAYAGYLLSPAILGPVAEYLGWTALWGLTAFAGMMIISLTRMARSGR
ncbi:MAG: hypothetical protein WBF53_16265 [Litorimonas sp.]